jgi:hypothetical protein
VVDRAGYCVCLLGHPAGVVERSAQDYLDLRVEAAQLIGSPASECVMDGGIEAQRNLLALPAHV